jgi:hypothetical protein
MKNQKPVANVAACPSTPTIGSGCPARLAPIALFVYNRPEHTRQTVEALRANQLARQSDLFVFADGAQNQSAAEGVRQVRQFIRTIDGFKSVKLIERDRNWGLSQSIIAGMNQLCEEQGRGIAVEDDVVTGPDFLSFVNSALDHYENEPKIFSVCGFNYPIELPAAYPNDAFFSYRFACWGWGTWKEKWQKVDWSVKDFPEFIADPERQKRFNRGGDDLSRLLVSQMAGKIDSWDTVWAYTHSKHSALALLPVASKAYNIGLDGSGTHCKGAAFEQRALAPGTNSGYRFPDSLHADPYFAAEIQRIHRHSTIRRLRRFLRRFRSNIKQFDAAAIPKVQG